MVELQMTPGQIAEAQQLARDFKPHNKSVLIILLHPKVQRPAVQAFSSRKMVI
jgi:hypothetical protein